MEGRLRNPLPPRKARNGRVTQAGPRLAVDASSITARQSPAVKCGRQRRLRPAPKPVVTTHCLRGARCAGRANLDRATARRALQARPENASQGTGAGGGTGTGRGTGDGEGWVLESDRDPAAEPAADPIARAAASSRRACFAR